MAQNKGAIVHTQKKGSDPFGSLPFSFPLYIVHCPFVLSASLLDALIFLYCLRGNRSRGLCAVSRLRIRRSRADRAPSLTARHAHCHADHRY